MIRPQLKQQLRQALGDGGSFEPDDFIIDIKSSPSDTVLSISCRFSDDFFLEARIVKRRGVTINIEVRPGAIVVEDIVAVADWDGLVAEVRAWRSRVAAELRAEPVVREIDAQRKELERLLSSLGKVEDAYFSKDEAAALRQKLDDLENVLAEQVRKSTENETQLEAKLTALHSDITALKEGLESLKKKGWAQRVMVKFGKWTRDPDVKEALKTGTEIVRGFLKGGS